MCGNRCGPMVPLHGFLTGCSWEVLSCYLNTTERTSICRGCYWSIIPPRSILTGQLWKLTSCSLNKEKENKCDPVLQNESHWDSSWNFDFYTLVKSIHFPFKWYQSYANLPIGSKIIDKSIWLGWRGPFWEIGLRKFISHTTVLQQLQFKMPETVIKHFIWPLKIMFSNRKMLKAPDFDWKSIFFTCGSKIVAFCIVTKYRCNSFRAAGSQMVYFILYQIPVHFFFGFFWSVWGGTGQWIPGYMQGTVCNCHFQSSLSQEVCAKFST